MKEAVAGVEEEMAAVMTAFVEKMQKHLVEMGRRWTEKKSYKGSSSSSDGISMAENRVPTDVLSKVDEMWGKRMAGGGQAHDPQYESLNSVVQILNMDLAALREKGGESSAASTAAASSGCGGSGCGRVPSGGGYGSMQAYFYAELIGAEGMEDRRQGGAIGAMSRDRRLIQVKLVPNGKLKANMTLMLQGRFDWEPLSKSNGTSICK